MNKTKTLGLLAVSWVLAAQFGAVITARDCPIWVLVLVSGVLGLLIAEVWCRVGEGT
ncbi:hypothetical protein [Solilutibacter oculi]|uniref:hypothetical protein n=1 Tax=Solilutibacter oculi TaxID=2698682 RepID=UPI0013A5FAB4|nr:hypothetical protein [Lysobacter oculi]